MFDLNESLAKLKSSLEAENFIETETDKQGNSKLKKENAPQKKNKVKSNKKSIKNQKKRNNDNINKMKSNVGVVMIKNFPHGFYEKQMFDYFSQFGEVTRLKIARSKKTGNPKNYGFIEFRFEDVAKVVVETMNNYMMFDHIIKCVLLPPEKIMQNLFRNWDKPFVSSVKKHKMNHNKNKNTEQEYRTICRHLKRIHKMEDILAKQGIEFKCVIVNRPSNLKKRSTKVKKEIASKSKNKISKRPLLEPVNDKDDEVTFKMPSFKIKKSKLQISKKLIIPKFRKLRAAGFRK